MTSRVALATLLVAGGGVFAVAAGAPAAQAADGGSGCSSATSGGTSGGGGSVSGSTVTIWAELSSHAHLCDQGTSSSGVDADAPPPPQCWWAPEYSPAGLAADIGQLDTNGGSASATYTALTGEYAFTGTGGNYPAGYLSTKAPPWDLFNVNAPGPSGVWWGLVWSDTITLAGIDSCTAIDTDHFPEDWYWVATTPDDAGVPADPRLTEEELADYVAGKVQLNPVVVQTNPDLNTTKATVGLPTWVWAEPGQDNTKIDPETICTQQLPVCVTLSAHAEGFTISTNDPAATVYGDCKADAAGVVGTPYTAGAGNPPCGVTFGSPGAWNLVLETTWQVKITYDGGALILHPAQIETDVAANIQEVQAVNN